MYSSCRFGALNVDFHSPPLLILTKWWTLSRMTLVKILRWYYEWQWAPDFDNNIVKASQVNAGFERFVLFFSTKKIPVPAGDEERQIMPTCNVVLIYSSIVGCSRMDRECRQPLKMRSQESGWIRLLIKFMATLEVPRQIRIRILFWKCWRSRNSGNGRVKQFFEHFSTSGEILWPSGCGKLSFTWTGRYENMSVVSDHL